MIRIQKNKVNILILCNQGLGIFESWHVLKTEFIRLRPDVPRKRIRMHWLGRLTKVLAHTKCLELENPTRDFGD